MYLFDYRCTASTFDWMKMKFPNLKNNWTKYISSFIFIALSSFVFAFDHQAFSKSLTEVDSNLGYYWDAFGIPAIRFANFVPMLAVLEMYTWNCKADNSGR